MNFVCRITLLLAVLATVSGCATGFLYDRADRLANRWVEGYVDLEPGQRAELRAGLADLHRWHREAQLPRYADWLRDAAARLGEDASFTPGELESRGAVLGEFWREIGTTALPLLTTLGASLDDQQVEALLADLREELARERLAAERRTETWHQQRRARSMERVLRRFAGSLSREQRAAVASWAAGLEPTRALFFDNRAGWVDELEVALAQRDDPATLERAAAALFLEPNRRWPPDYEAAVGHNTARTLDFLASFLDSLDDRQRARVVSRLEQLADEFEQLGRAGG